MATKGYCGYLISYVGDIARNEELSILINTSNKWLVTNTTTMELEANRILEDTLDKDVFFVWYNVPMKDQ